MPEDPRKAPKSGPKSGAERRRYPRYSFFAAAEFLEVLEAESGNRIDTSVTHLGQRGCYLKTERTLPIGTNAIVRIKKGERVVEVCARVVYSKAGDGMGLEFSPIEPEQFQILEEWLSASRESAWLASTRRRSQRLLLRLKVRVSGQISAGERFEEEVSTLAISPYGGLVLLATPVSKGQPITLSNVRTSEQVECIVVYVGDHEGDYIQTGVEFLSPNAKFWQVAFPPEEWTPSHPDAKQK